MYEVFVFFSFSIKNNEQYLKMSRYGYIGKKVIPNYQFLNNAIIQTENKNLAIDLNILVQLLSNRIETTNFKQVIDDVRPFLINPQELRFFDKEIFLKMVQNLNIKR